MTDTEDPKPWLAEGCDPGLVSVIIPTYNRADLITGTLESVFAQTYRPVEIIVVDDGSTDDTAAAVGGFERRTGADETLRRVLQEHAGAPAARNRGLAESRGEFVQFLDSDDTIAPDKIGTQVTALRADPSASAAYGPWRCDYPGRRRRLGPRRQENPQPSDDAMLRGYLSAGWFVPLHGYLFTRGAIVTVGPWDESLLRRQDADYLTRALLAGCRFVYAPGAEALYARHPGEHIGRTDTFKQHFDSVLHLARKWHGLLREGGKLQTHGGEIARFLWSLEEEAAVAGFSAGVRACREEVARLFGEEGNALRPGAIRRLLRIELRRWIFRPLKRVVGEAAMERIGSVARRLL